MAVAPAFLVCFCLYCILDIKNDCEVTKKICCGEKKKKKEGEEEEDKGEVKMERSEMKRGSRKGKMNSVVPGYANLGKRERGTVDVVG